MRLRPVSALLSLAAACACSSSPSTSLPEVTQRGRHLVEYRGPEAYAELATSWADRHLGDEWLVLKLTLTGTAGHSTVVDRQEVRVRTPAGHILVMIDQSEFRRIFGELRVALERIDAWGPPSARFSAFETPCQQWFLAPPWSMADRASLRINPGQWCSGPLVFRVPGGVQPGPWLLLVELAEGELRVPFQLSE